MKYTGDKDSTFPRLSSSLNNSNQNSGESAPRKNDKGSQENFVWASGATYQGDTDNGRRTGKGKQTWPNGSSYEGDFLNDMRHGEGKHTWSSGEVYEGSFYRDHIHGKGGYKWPDGSQYCGAFYLDRKEGYGTFTFANGDVFDGLYGKDERCGPGILTYKNSNKQDIGLWYREKLIRLCSFVDGVFTMKDHTEYQYFPEEHLSQIDLKKDDSYEVTMLEKENSLRFSGQDLHTALLMEENFLPDGIEHYSKDLEHLPLPMTLRESLDQAFFKDSFDLVKNDQDALLIVRNNTPLLVDLQTQIYKHRHEAGSFNSSVAMVEGTPRGTFKSDQGPLEGMSESLILAASEGDGKTVYTLLKSGLVNPNVCDCQGNTPLLGAAVNCHGHIVNLLLDMGADIDQVNDEGVSALTACHIFYYPIEHFKPNIAEKYVNDHLISQQEKASSKLKRDRRGSLPTKKRQEKIILSPLLYEENQQKVNKVTRRPALSSPRNQNSSPVNENLSHKDAVECCKSDVRIKAHFREISSARSRQRDENDDIEVDESSISLESMRSSTDMSNASKKNLIDFPVEIPEDLIERTATLLSMNRRAVSGISTRDGQAITLGKTGALAVWKAEHQELRQMIELLLQRGADPNKSSVPMPALFFAVKAGDISMIRLLLLKGAATETRISEKLGGFTPLHIASAIPNKEGVEAVKLLLQAGANPNIAAQDEEIPHDKNVHGGSVSSDGPGSVKKANLYSQWVSEGLKNVDESGRRPLHIACDRDDDYKIASEVAHELLDNGADPDVIWSGHSPLSLAICSGNDLAIETLLNFGADASMPLKRGVGNALCASANTDYEYRRSPDDRIKLVNKLVDSGANMLAPVVFGSKQVTGTVVDYAHWMFNKDARIAHTPYHALSYQERDTYNARKQLLAHYGNLLRDAAVKVEREKLRREGKFGVRSVSPSRNERFLYTGAGAKPQVAPPSSPPPSRTAQASPSHVSFPDKALESEQPFSNIPSTVISKVETEIKSFNDQKALKKLKGRTSSGPIRKPLFRYCYECGRSVGVRLTTCSRCREVYFCSRSCKLKAWEERHKNECLRMKKIRQQTSPTPSEIASYFTTQTLNEALLNDPTIESIRISPRSIVRNTEFLPISKSERILSSKTQLSKVKSNRKKAASAKSGLTHKSSLKPSPRRAHISKSLKSQVGKEVEFGTTGMTLAELGITENYSFN